ncbi:MAG: hypothetical protein DI535_00345 [Citrobacter freundii]|nr:MAG: hypothetical protein DI535_00345 [Citrobacter freundii]
MANHLMMTPLVEELIASAGPERLCLISPHAHDAALLKEQTGYPVSYFNDLPPDLSGKHLVLIPIAMEGFFELLKTIDRNTVKVIAIINDLAEEFMAAKFIGVASVLRVTLSA